MAPKVKFEVEGWECIRCGHQWIPRTMTDTEPTICPKCKSPYWNKPRRIDSTELARLALKEKRRRDKGEEL